MVNKNRMLNTRIMEVNVYFGRNVPLETALSVFFTDPILHGHQLCLLSHNTLLTCLKLAVRGAIAVITE